MGKAATTEPTRITIAFSNRRKPLEAVLRDELKAHPRANAKLSGGPGRWQVMRDVVDSDDTSTHQARDLRRSL